MVVDLSGVGFAGSAALGNFVALHRAARQRGGRLVLCNVDPTVREVLRASKLDVLFEFAGDRADALRVIKETPPAARRRSERRPRLLPRKASLAPRSGRRHCVAGRETRIHVTERSLRHERAAPRRAKKSDPTAHTLVVRRRFLQFKRPSRTDVRSWVANGLIATHIGVSTMSATTRIQVNDPTGSRSSVFRIISFSTSERFARSPIRSPKRCPNDGSPIRLVVDFSDVSLISSTFLSKLILLQRRIDATRGKMRLCEMTPMIQQVFRTSNLDRLFKIDRDQRTAIDSFH